LAIKEPEVREDDFAFVYLNLDQMPVAWAAYRGILNSPDVQSANPANLSFFLMETVRRGLTSALRREGVLEGYAPVVIATLQEGASFSVSDIVLI
jgi:hypothetical protein